MLVLFTLVVLLGVIMMMALLFDGAMALASRRSMQDAVDAAALAGANALTSTGCVYGVTPPLAIRAAVSDSLIRNGWNGGAPVVTCPAGWQSAAVTVTLSSPGTRFVLVGMPITVDSTAINGGMFAVAMSVVTLNPGNPPKTGCSSFQFNGGVTLTFEGGVHVNSADTIATCGTGDAAAVQKGSSGTIVFQADQPMQITGGQVGIKAIPTPLTGMGVLEDPFGTLAEPSVAMFGLGAAKAVPGFSSVTVDKTKYNVLVLAPGSYTSGGVITLANSSYYLALRPGVFIFDSVTLANSGGTVCTIPDKNPATGSAWSNADIPKFCASKAAWQAKCVVGPSCGVLLMFSNPPAKCSGASSIVVSASGTIFLNPYFSGAAVGDARSKYDGFLVWTARSIDAARGCQVSLQGGGTSEIAGTVYAKTVKVSMQGSTSGTGAGESTLQFIVYDLSFGGTADFIFRYNAGSLAKFTGYGLVD